VKKMDIGSMETRQEAGGDRRRNDEKFRRVGVDISLRTSKGVLPIQQNRSLAFTHRWYVTVRKFTAIGYGGAVVVGSISLVLKNALSGKTNGSRIQTGGTGLCPRSPYSVQCGK
jgi:hypothetical protein